MENNEYKKYLISKRQIDKDYGFDPIFIPDYLFDFQKYFTEWSVKKGRGGFFGDCGLGKTILQLVWAENIVRKTNKNVLILTPLAVSKQTEREAEKFGIEAKVYSKKINKITIINYEKMHYLDPNDFIGTVCDESGILKNFDGKTKHKINIFMRKMPYRFLYTATPSPNDYIELGNSSEVLGYLGFIDMLNRFFKNEQNNSALRRMYGKAQMWRFKGYSQDFFWRWVSSWARTIRKPSDYGFDDNGFILPEKKENLHIVEASRPYKGFMLLPAVGLREERKERRATLNERCEKVANLVNSNNKPTIVWCDYNVEGDLLEELIPDAYQVAGKHSDEIKEERLLGFADNKFRVLITKAKIGGWGLNYQHCSHMTCFPSHSFEKYYQTIRRCWRFGQKEKVIVDIISTKGEVNVLKNLQKKQKKADEMFDNLLLFMNKSLKIEKDVKKYDKKEVIPLWLKDN
jgi:superfamily II DNA or RNA helicase